jgi:hypothetical protein
MEPHHREADGATTGHGLDNWTSIPGSGKRYFRSAQRPDRFWGPLGLLTQGYRVDFPPEVK